MVNPLPHVPAKKKKNYGHSEPSSWTKTYSNETGPRRRKGDTKDGYVKVEIGVVFSQTEGSLRRPEAGAGG